MEKIVDYIKQKNGRVVSLIWSGRKEFNFLCLHHIDFSEALGFETYQATPYLKLVKENAVLNEEHLDEIIEKRYFDYSYFDADVQELKKMLNILAEPSGGGCFGPLTIASGIYGIERLLKDIVKKPHIIHKLLNYITSFIKELALRETEAGGDFFWIAEPLASVVSPKIFWEFSGIYLKDIFDVAKVPGFLHVCGQTIKHTDYMVKTGAQVLSIDYMTDIKKCLEMVPEDVVIIGNVSPILLKMGTLEEVHEECIRILEDCKGYDNFIMGTGCSVIEETPEDNVEEIFRTVEAYSENV